MSPNYLLFNSRELLEWRNELLIRVAIWKKVSSLLNCHFHRDSQDRERAKQKQWKYCQESSRYSLCENSQLECSAQSSSSARPYLVTNENKNEVRERRNDCVEGKCVYCIRCPDAFIKLTLWFLQVLQERFLECPVLGKCLLRSYSDCVF